MDTISYLDFDLQIQRAGTEYRAQILNSPKGQASSSFTLPFADVELENFILRIGRTRRLTRRKDSPEVQAAKSFGGKLFTAIFNDQVRDCLRSSIDEASRQGAGLRIKLRLTDVPELVDIPWEYLYNPIDDFLALSNETPLIRYLEFQEIVRPLTLTLPLRVLVMISSPSDYDQLDVNREWINLREALSALEQRGLVALERLEDATLAGLQRRLRRGQYHIFHYIGHGGFDSESQCGVLVLEDNDKRSRNISGEDLGRILRDHRSMRLAVLNACEGARADRNDPFAGTAQSLIKKRIPAVIAMQFEITDEAAITFAQEFYGAIADGYPVDASLAEARKAIFAQGNGLEWGTPVLYLRSPDGRIFDVHQADELRRQIRIADHYEDAQASIARGEWTSAIEKLRVVLSLDAAHKEALNSLAYAEKQQRSAATKLRQEAGSSAQPAHDERRADEDDEATAVITKRKSPKSESDVSEQISPAVEESKARWLSGKMLTLFGALIAASLLIGLVIWLAWARVYDKRPADDTNMNAVRANSEAPPTTDNRSALNANASASLPPVPATSPQTSPSTKPSPTQSPRPAPSSTPSNGNRAVSPRVVANQPPNNNTVNKRAASTSMTRQPTSRPRATPSPRTTTPNTRGVQGQNRNSALQILGANQNRRPPDEE